MEWFSFLSHAGCHGLKAIFAKVFNSSKSLRLMMTEE
jgi:hypothetical protein